MIEVVISGWLIGVAIALPVGPVITEMIRRGCTVYARPMRGPWADVGTPEDLAAAQALFAGEP